MRTGSYKETQDGGYRLFLDPGIYSKEAIIKALHLFTHKCHINFSSYNDRQAQVDFSRRDKETKIEEVIRDFLNELIDQQLRLTITQETRKIHELIVAEAFAPLNESE